MAKIRAIVPLDAPVIRKIAEPVSTINCEATQNLIDDLMLSCTNAKGMGISAPQIGQSKRIFIMSSQPNERYPNAPQMQPIAIINAQIIRHSYAVEKDWEGCLTIPGVRGFVPRYKNIMVTYSTRDEKKVNTQYNGFLARLFQHEFDHLNGKVFIDRVESQRDIITEKEFQDIISAGICPFCKTKNNCMAHVKESCWCHSSEIPEQLLALLPKESKGKACICRSCIQSFKEDPHKFKISY